LCFPQGVKCIECSSISFIEEAEMKKREILISVLILILLSSCLNFQSIYQPVKSLPDDIISVSITVRKSTNDHAEPYFGVCLPEGWTIPGDSIQCRGAYNNVIYYDDSLSIAQNTISPALHGYYWWVGKGEDVSVEVGNVYAELQIQTDNQIGFFMIDYMLGDSYNGLNVKRSDNYQVEIIDDEFCPRRFIAGVEGNSVNINWQEPPNSTGLIGYNIYCDEEQINANIITDTTFNDGNPVEGIHSYTISSVYTDRSEHMIPYDKSVVYKSIYISPNGSNANNGSSFSDALQNISYSMPFIKADSLNPITIFLAPGYYSNYTNEEQFPITCLSNVSIAGSGENNTILYGDDQNTILQYINAEGITVDDLTITNGRSGFYCSNSSVELSNITISDNAGSGFNCNESNLSLMNITVVENDGVGIYLDHVNASLDNITIKDNNGSGIFCGSSVLNLVNVDISYHVSHGINCNNSTVNLNNVNIANNSAWHSGGGIYCSYSTLDFTDGNIINNSSEGSGGGIYADYSILDLSNVLITNNVSDEGGGGIFSSKSAFDLANVNIKDNRTAWNGGGIYSDSSAFDLSSVDILDNIAPGNGGGLNCVYNSTVNFDSTNNCNIYLNRAVYGNDIASDTLMNVVVDKFTVLNPTDFQAAPLENFTFDILQGEVIQAEADLFVSPDGDNTNSGFTENEPLKTIYYAQNKILVDSLHPHTIFLLEGTYSDSANGEFFPVSIHNYASISGETDSTVILDGNGFPSVIRICGERETSISDLTISGSNYAGIYCESSNASFSRLNIINNSDKGLYCNNSSPELTNITIADNDGIGLEIGNGSSPVLENLMIINNGSRGISCYENSNPSLDSVTISGNNDDGITIYHSSNPTLENINISGNNGRGIYCFDNSNPELINITVKDNENEGVFCLSSSSPTLNNVVIYNSNGSGLYCGDNSNPTLEYVIISGDSATWGGGIFCESNSNPTLSKVTIENNYARFGGGIFIDNSNPVLDSVTIENNSARYSGGGIYCTNYSSPSIVNCEVINNTVSYPYNYYGGGGICCEYNSNLVLDNVVISGNSCNSYGGGIYCIANSDMNMTNVAIIDNEAGSNGGGIYCASHTNAVLENVLISGNFTGSRGRGGGIFSSYYADLSLTNVTMTNNRARDGGGINFGENSNLDIKNSILWNESEVQVYSGVNVFPCTVTVSYTDMLDGEAGIYIRGNRVTVNWLDGNINSDPLFDVLPNPPFLLSAGSPCIDAGHPASIYNDPEDPSNPGYALWPSMGTIRNDMGAYGGPNAAPFSIVVGVKDRKNEDVQIPTGLKRKIICRTCIV
jgi:parallel beta-helix repeat protein/predicted outer membrane repeat protein